MHPGRGLLKPFHSWASFHVMSSQNGGHRTLCADDRDIDEIRLSPIVPLSTNSPARTSCWGIWHAFIHFLKIPFLFYVSVFSVSCPFQIIFSYLFPNVSMSISSGSFCFPTSRTVQWHTSFPTRAGQLSGSSDHRHCFNLSPAAVSLRPQCLSSGACSRRTTSPHRHMQSLFFHPSSLVTVANSTVPWVQVIVHSVVYWCVCVFLSQMVIFRVVQ